MLELPISSTARRALYVGFTQVEGISYIANVQKFIVKYLFITDTKVISNRITKYISVLQTNKIDPYNKIIRNLAIEEKRKQRSRKDAESLFES